MHPIKRGLIAVLLTVAAFAMVVLPLAVSAQTPPTPPVSAAPMPDAEEVSSFASDVTVRPDGVVSVIERIEYFFPEQRHGIFRDIPLVYDIDGKKVRIPVENVTVSGARYALEGGKDSVRIRIGDPDTYVSGAVSYVIGYELHGALFYGDDADKLIFDVTGNDWEVPIRRASAVVHLPAAVDAESISFRCFTGDYGSTASDCLANVMAKDVHFIAAGPVTVEAEWGPKGAVAVLEPVRSWTDVFSTTFALAAFLLAIPLLTLFTMIRAWRGKGRDHAVLGAVPPQYDAPEGMRPAILGIIADERLDHRDLAATVIDLAIRGHVRIEERRTGLIVKTKDFELIWLENAKDALAPYEKELLEAVFGGDSSVLLSKMKTSDEVYRAMRGVGSTLYERATKEGYFTENPDAVRTKYVVSGVVGMVIGFGLLFVGALAMPLLMLAISFIASGLIVLGFSSAMPAKTAKGVEAYRHILGFREYLSRAEKYRLQWQEKENVLEAFLPYAMAFGVVEKWTKTMQSFGKEMQQPTWYAGSSTGAFDAGAFGKSMGAFGAGIASANTKQSSGSASSGGGFSGGGVGGGGGGSW